MYSQWAQQILKGLREFWEVTHMGRVQDMVTGLLNGSSSMIPLFFRSKGVGFAVEKTSTDSW